MMMSRGRSLWAPSLLLLGVLPACDRPQEARAASPRSKTATASGDDVVAEFSGGKVTRAEVDKRAAGQLAAIEQQQYDARRAVLDQIVAERLLEREAATRRISTSDLLKAEVEDKLKAPAAAEIDAIYKQYQAQLGGRTREQSAPDIIRALREQGLTARRGAFQQELRKKAAVRVALEAPRTEVPVPANAPAVGPDKAGVTIVEYLDYQCPYCRRAHATMEQVLSQYPGKIRFVHRDFPLEGHPRALPASRAVRCAGEHGKFWEFHRSLFDATGDFSDTDLKAKAAALGIEASAFSACLASTRNDPSIRASYDSGTEAGVTSTPTFFVNGRRLLGARPLEQFQEVIEEELAAAR